jgi:hypothetical protein
VILRGPCAGVTAAVAKIQQAEQMAIGTLQRIATLRAITTAWSRPRPPVRR